MFLDLHRDKVLEDTAANIGIGERTFLIVLRVSIVLVKRIGGQTIAGHVAGQCEWIGRILTCILHERPHGKNAITSNEQGPAIQGGWDFAPALSWIFVPRPVVNPGTRREIHWTARCALFVDRR